MYANVNYGRTVKSYRRIGVVVVVILISASTALFESLFNLILMLKLLSLVILSQSLINV